MAVADYHRRRHGLAFAAEDIMVGPGSKELMFLLQLCFAGDIVIPTPSWVSYVPQARLAGRRVVRVPGGGRHGLMVDPATLRAACGDDRRPRLLFLNSPSNPTGLAYTDAELAALAEVCRDLGMVVLSDEIYNELTFDGAQHSLARHYPEGTLVSSGLSKWCGAGGWRLGTLALPESLRPLRRALEAVASETYSTTSAPVQRAAITAFRPNVDVEAYLFDARRVLGVLLTWAAHELTQGGLTVPEPVGGFYLFPCFAPLRAALAARGIRDDVGLAELLLTETGVVILPGSDCGMAPDALWMRIALVDFDGARALSAAAAAVLDTSFLRQHLTPAWDAMTTLARWCGELAAEQTP